MDTTPQAVPAVARMDPSYLRLLDALNVGFAYMDMDFGILEVNETLLKMVGATRAEVVGHHASEFYEPNDFKRLYDMDLQAQNQDLNYQYEFYLHQRDSEEKIPVLFNISTNLDPFGKPVSQYVTFSDIRQQKQVQAALETANQALQKSQGELAQANRELETKQDALKLEKQMLETILLGIGDFVTVFDSNEQILLGTPKRNQLNDAPNRPVLPLDSKGTVHLEFQQKDRNRSFIGQVKRIRNPQGNVIAYAEILKEVTDQKKLAEKEIELHRMKRLIGRKSIKTRMIGVSSAMQKISDLILRCADVDSTVLILGETGVGKEVVARAIHLQSHRKQAPFVAVNCGALPEHLLESELFGHTKGAFTGAIADHMGLFREATGGTLFLDEVGDLQLSLQVKVLRALQEKEVRPVGSRKSYPVDVRVIAATHRDLLQRVNNHLFRQDLYYRLAVIPLYIPPLRERREDILPLIKHFLKKHGQAAKNTKSISLSHQAQKILITHEWQGNIRELENAVEHALAMRNGLVIEPRDLPVQVLGDMPSAPAKDAVPFVTTRQIASQEAPLPLGKDDLKPWQSDERDLILKTIIACKGNRTQTAKTLGFSRSTLWRKMTMYRLTI